MRECQLLWNNKLWAITTVLCIPYVSVPFVKSIPSWPLTLSITSSWGVPDPHLQHNQPMHPTGAALAARFCLCCLLEGEKLVSEFDCCMLLVRKLGAWLYGLSCSLSGMLAIRSLNRSSSWSIASTWSATGSGMDFDFGTADQASELDHPDKFWWSTP